MSRRIVREDALQFARQYTRENESSSLAAALADPTVDPGEMLGALLHACGSGYVVADDAGASVVLDAGATQATASQQLSFDRQTEQLSGVAADMAEKAYLLLLAVEHDLDAAVYLPPDMRRDRVQVVCRRVGVDEEFFRMILRNSTL